jgi:hypothetical protein
MGMVFGVLSFGALIGTSVAGVLTSRPGGSYVGAQVFVGTCLAVAGVLFLAARNIKRRKTTSGM